MAFESSHVKELRAEEERILRKFEAKARSLQSVNPKLSYQMAYAQAVLALPRAYENYCNVRRELSLLGVMPQIPKGLLSQGNR